MNNGCPKCVEITCEVHGCQNYQAYEGWVKVIGPFDIPTGVIQRRRVCEEHKMALIGFQKGKSPQRNTGCKKCDELEHPELCLDCQLEQAEHDVLKAMNRVEEIKQRIRKEKE